MATAFVNLKKAKININLLKLISSLCTNPKKIQFEHLFLLEFKIMKIALFNDNY